MLYLTINNNTIIFISPEDPTYWPAHENRHPDILDFFLSKLPSHINYCVSNLCKLGFDYILVLQTVNETPKLNPPHAPLFQSPVNWDKFPKIIHNNTNLHLSLK